MLTDDSLFAQVALPVLDDTADERPGRRAGGAGRALGARLAGPGGGAHPAAARRLRTRTQLPDAFDEPDAVPIGLRQDTMEPALLDLGGTRPAPARARRHRRGQDDAAADRRSRGLLERYTADELVIAVIDLRGDVAAEVPDDYLGGARLQRGRWPAGCPPPIADELEKRLTRTGEGRPAGASTEGPRIVVVVDDYDIVASGGTEPAAPLLPYLPSARDLRLHLLLTRPVAGVGRAMYDLVLQTLRDTGGSLLLMSGERGEGQVVPGVYAEQMVPGRGRLVRRGERPRIVQVANTTPSVAGQLRSRATHPEGTPCRVTSLSCRPSR